MFPFGNCMGKGSCTTNIGLDPGNCGACGVVCPSGICVAGQCQYTIGGTVSGLAGAGLVLQNNGGDDLPIGANGVFTFATSVASGSTYAVTVSSQPSGQPACSVSSGGGIVGGANITSVTVTCGSLTTSIVSENPSASSTNSNSIDFTLSSNVAGATYACSLDGSAPAPCSSTPSYSGLAGGTHTFVAYASTNGVTDTVGASYSWTVDTTPPALASIDSSSTGTTFTVNWDTSKPATTEFGWAKGSAALTYLPEDMTLSTTHTVTITGLSNFTIYTYSVGGHDAAGNEFWSARNAVRTGSGP
jgi:hypothetical protein